MDLFEQLGKIYQATGVRIDKEYINKKGLTVVERSLTPYFFYNTENTDSAAFKSEVINMSNRGRHIYSEYIRNRNKKNEYRKMNWSQCAWAWGQGTMRATPLNMARVAAIVVNNGTLAHTRYLLPQSGNEDSTLITTNKDRVCATSLETLKSYMKDQARLKASIFNPAIGGKTGTPERIHNYKYKTGKQATFTGQRNGGRLGKSKAENDAWYIFFVDSDGVNQSKAKKLAVAIRIERAKSTSSLAMQVTRNQIIPVLTELGYMK